MLLGMPLVDSHFSWWKEEGLLEAVKEKKSGLENEVTYGKK